MNAEPRQEPSSGEGAGNTDDDIAEKAETAALDDRACKPACDRSDHKPDEQCLTFHVCPPWLAPSPEDGRLVSPVKPARAVIARAESSLRREFQADRTDACRNVQAPVAGYAERLKIDRLVE